MSDTDHLTDVPVEPAGDRTSGTSGDRRFPKWVTYVVLGGIALVVLFFGAIFLYAKVINDSPDQFTAADLDAALSAPAADPTAPAATVATGQPPVVGETPTTAPAAASAGSGDQSVAAAGTSQWAATDGSQVGYRVQEVLFGVDTTAVGRTNKVTGALTIDGDNVTAGDFSIDVASITSDEGRRDAQFRGRVMSADQFPTATFKLTQPIALGTAPIDGAAVTATATGELTLRGVTNPVTFDVTAKQDNGKIGVQGSIPVVFADYGIANPSNGGIKTEDDGLVEFVLVFQPA